MLIDGLERRGYLDADDDGVVEHHGAVPEPRANRFAAHVLHRKPQDAVVIADVEDSRDVWMVDGGSRSRFEKKAVARAMECRNSREDFDGDVATQRFISGEVDDAHATFAQRRKQRIPP